MIPDITRRLEVRLKPEDKSVVMKQTWNDLLFVHWKYDSAYIQSLLPEGLYVDTFEGDAYAGIAPFYLSDLRPLQLPSMPAISNFPEVNVRTYVYDKNGTPGIYFFSLDADQKIAVKTAQLFSIPYKYAQISYNKNSGSGEVTFEILREGMPKEKTSRFIYNIEGGNYHAEPDSLEFFLIERYILFAYNNFISRLYAVQVHHHPYQLQKVELKEWDENLLLLDGIKMNNRQPDHVISAASMEVDFYTPYTI